MTTSIVNKFNNDCVEYLNLELNTRLRSSLSILTDKTTSDYYLTEYKRCIDEQLNFKNYINEQIESLNTLKSYETALDSFIERLKTVHEYELKQNELFEQILHELTKNNPSSKEERQRLLEQIDELIVYKSKLTDLGSNRQTTSIKLASNSNDTFKNVL